MIARTVVAIVVGIGAAETSFLQPGADRCGGAECPQQCRPARTDPAGLGCCNDGLAAEVRSRALRGRPHSFSDYAAEFTAHELASQLIDGLGISGPEKCVRSLAGVLKLLR
jgi:hypothetical protein